MSSYDQSQQPYYGQPQQFGTPQPQQPYGQPQYPFPPQSYIQVQPPTDLNDRTQSYHHAVTTQPQSGAQAPIHAQPEEEEQGCCSLYLALARDCCGMVYCMTCCPCICVGCLPEPKVVKEMRESGDDSCCELVTHCCVLACHCLELIMCPKTYRMHRGMGYGGQATLHQERNNDCCACIGIQGSVESSEHRQGAQGEYTEKREWQFCCLSGESSETEKDNGCFTSRRSSADIDADTDHCCCMPCNLVANCCSTMASNLGGFCKTIVTCDDNCQPQECFCQVASCLGEAICSAAKDCNPDDLDCCSD